MRRELGFLGALVLVAVGCEPLDSGSTIEDSGLAVVDASDIALPDIALPDQGARDAAAPPPDAGAPDCQADADCSEDRFCNADGRCLPGCRLDDPDACPGETLICDARHECNEVRCDSSDECPDAYFCDDTGVCRIGCGANGDCAEGLICVERQCFDFGYPDRPCVDDLECGGGRFCVDGECRREGCQDDFECFDSDYCDLDINECVMGCRDDRPAHDSVDNAFAIELPADFDADGFKIATVDGRRFCGDRADFFSVDLGQAQRMQLQLSYDPAILENLNLRLTGDEVDGVQEWLGILNPKAIEYPQLNDLRGATTYFAEVFGDIGLPEGMDYQIRVVVGDMDTQCFPDYGEDRDGDDTPELARRQNDDVGAYAGNACAGDEDWFVLSLDDQGGLVVEASITPESGALEFLVYSAARLRQAGGLGNPNYRSPPMPLDGPDGRTYTLDLPSGQGNFVGRDDWYVRVKTRDANANATYSLRISRDSGPSCGNDSGAEPNDTIMTSVDVDVGLDVDVQVPLDLEICARDEDVFCFDVDDGDVVEAWTVGVGVAGDFTIQLLNGMGGLVGQRANHNVAGSDDRALWIGAVAGRACVRVDGIEAGHGAYDLFVHRRAGGNMCENDEDEVEVRNDAAASAVPLNVLVPGTRYEHSTGYVCDVRGADQDWYAFPVIEDDSALCIMLEGFQNNVADLDLSAFPVTPLGAACMDHADCRDGRRCVDGTCELLCANDDVCADEEACIAGRCTASPNGYFSRTRFDFETKSVPRSVVGDRSGDHLLRVDRGAVGNESGYTVSVTVSPETAPDDCPRDFREQAGSNDSRETATRLGSGQIGFCDAWICERAEGLPGRGDWYEIDVPSGEARTVLIEFAALPVDGRLSLELDPGLLRGSVRSIAPIAGFQCINVRGGAVDQPVWVNVGLDALADADPDGRVDYTLRVVPTDLDARPQGECLTFGAPNLGACPVGQAMGQACWPTVEL